MKKVTILAIALSMAMTACSKHHDGSDSSAQNQVQPTPVPPIPGPTPVKKDDQAKNDEAQAIKLLFPTQMSNETCENEFEGLTYNYQTVGDTDEYTTTHFKLKVFIGGYYQLETTDDIEYTPKVGKRYYTSKYNLTDSQLELVDTHLLLKDADGNQIAKVFADSDGTSIPRLSMVFVGGAVAESGETGWIQLAGSHIPCDIE